MCGTLRLMGKIRRHSSKVIWTINLLLSVWFVWRLPNSEYGTRLLNWSILDTLPPTTQLLYDDWSTVTAKERLLPGLGPSTVHYVWCDSAPFVYNNYLSILSAFKVVKPDKIIIHVTHNSQNVKSPETYLLDELLYTIPIITVRRLPEGHACSLETRHNLALFIYTILSEGGIIVGPNTIVTEFSPLWRNKTMVNSLTVEKDTHGVLQVEGIFVSRGNTGFVIQKDNLGSILKTNDTGSPRCGSVVEYNLAPKSVSCVVLNESISFKDMLESRTRFGKITRWLAFGSTDVVMPLASNITQIPLVAHVVWRDPREFELLDYLSVLSAVKVGGFVVKFYSYSEPSGVHWERLMATGRVQSILINSYDFGHNVSPGFSGDVLCVELVLREGGVCHTTRVLWRALLPPYLRHYDLVMGQKPDSLGVSVIIGKRRARFLENLLPNLRLYEGNNWEAESVRTVYRMYQKFPNMVFTAHSLYGDCNSYGCFQTDQNSETLSSSALFVNILPSAEKLFQSLETVKTIDGPLAGIVNDIIAL